MTYEVDTHQSTQEINWAEFDALWEDYAQTVKIMPPRGNLKKKAMGYIDRRELSRGLNKRLLRKIVVKSKKIKKSSKKDTRRHDSQLTDRVNWYIHFYQ
jgi:hypothetical protein